MPDKEIRFLPLREKVETPEANPAEIGRRDISDLSSSDFQVIRDFFQTLREKYPEDQYPSEDVLNRMGIGEDPERHFVAYTAASDNKTSGVVVGEQEPGQFKGIWFAIDPEFQNKGIAKSLVERIAGDFDKVTLVARTFGMSAAATPTEQIRRQKALIRYYERLGFQPDISSELYKYSQVEGGPIPMIWEKAKD